MRNTRGIIAVGFLVTAVLVAGSTSEVQAFDFDTFRAELEQRRAERRASLEERFSSIRDNDEEKNEEVPASSDNNAADNDTEEENENACECRARMSLARPDVRWNNGVLEFVPRFDLSVRVDGDSSTEPWNLRLAYSGKADTLSYSGERTFGGQCFDGRYSHSGLTGEPVSISHIARSLFGIDSDEREVPISINAALTGCDTDSEVKGVEVEVAEFGNLDVSRWSRLRLR